MRLQSSISALFLSFIVVSGLVIPPLKPAVSEIFHNRSSSRYLTIVFATSLSSCINIVSGVMKKKEILMESISKAAHQRIME